MFCHENKVIYPVYLSNQNFDDSMDLLLISSNFVSHYVYIRDFNRLIFNKTKYKGKKYFCTSCLQCFSSGSVLNEHKDIDIGISNDDISYTKKYQDHVPCSFIYKVVCIDNKYSKKKKKNV